MENSVQRLDNNLPKSDDGETSEVASLDNNVGSIDDADSLQVTSSSEEMHSSPSVDENQKVVKEESDNEVEEVSCPSDSEEEVEIIVSGSDDEHVIEISDGDDSLKEIIVSEDDGDDSCVIIEKVESEHEISSDSDDVEIEGDAEVVEEGDAEVEEEGDAEVEEEGEDEVEEEEEGEEEEDGEVKEEKTDKIVKDEIEPGTEKTHNVFASETSILSGSIEDGELDGSRDSHDMIHSPSRKRLADEIDTSGIPYVSDDELDSLEDGEISFENLSDHLDESESGLTCSFVIDQSPPPPVKKIKVEMAKSESTKKVNKLNACWNCGSADHALRDCTEPKNIQMVSMNRQRFMANKQNTVDLKSAAEVAYLKYSDVRAGEISNDLREALGISDSEVPEYIYRMRALGYPPGHVLPIRRKFTGWCFLEARGVTEDGEISDTEKVRYRLGGIIDFPGFNTDLPSGVKDIHKKMNAPPMNKYQRKEYLVEHLRSLSYKIKKNQAPDNYEGVEMETEADDPDEEDLPPLPPPLPDNEPPPLPKDPCPDTPGDEEEFILDRNGRKLTGVDLEMYKKRQSLTPIQKGGERLHWAKKTPDLENFSKGIGEYPIPDEEESPTVATGLYEELLEARKMLDEAKKSEDYF